MQKFIHVEKPFVAPLSGLLPFPSDEWFLACSASWAAPRPGWPRRLRCRRLRGPS